MTRYWLCDPGGQQQGPFALEQVREMLSAGRVSPTSVVCPEGQSEWAPIGSVLASSPAPPPPPPPLPPGAPAGAGVVVAESGMGWVVPVSADPLVIAASYMSLFGLVVPLLGPAALIMAIVAWRRRDRYPSSANVVRIVVTIVLGLLGCLSTAGALFGIVMATSAKSAAGGF